MIKIQNFVFNPFQVNSFILYNESNDCFLVDASCQSDEEIKTVENFIVSKNLKLKALLNTHGHVDHLPGINYFKNKYNIPFYLHKEDIFHVERAVSHGAIFGFSIEQPPLPDRELIEGEVIELGNDRIDLIHVPGHSKGSIVFHLKEEKTLITGDVLFSMSIGRTDLPGGDYNELIKGIKEKLLILDDDIEILPGHGPSTRIGLERKMNPFLQ